MNIKIMGIIGNYCMNDIIQNRGTLLEFNTENIVLLCSIKLCQKEVYPYGRYECQNIYYRRIFLR